jgi:hypothetical protein
MGKERPVLSSPLKYSESSLHALEDNSVAFHERSHPGIPPYAKGGFRICHNCCNMSRVSLFPLPCPLCSLVLFCSVNCRDEAMATYHSKECFRPYLCLKGLVFEICQTTQSLLLRLAVNCYLSLQGSETLTEKMSRIVGVGQETKYQDFSELAADWQTDKVGILKTLTKVLLSMGMLSSQKEAEMTAHAFVPIATAIHGLAITCQPFSGHLLKTLPRRKPGEIPVGIPVEIVWGMSNAKYIFTSNRNAREVTLYASENICSGQTVTYYGGRSLAMYVNMYEDSSFDVKCQF